MERVEQVRRSLLDHATDRVAQSFGNPIHAWLTAHPLLEWWVLHPIWALSLVIVAIALLVGLFGAIGRLTENVWLTVFKIVLKLMRWVAIASFTLFKAIFRIARRLSRVMYPAGLAPDASTPDLIQLSSLGSAKPVDSAIAPDASQNSKRILTQDSLSPSHPRLLELLTQLNRLHQEEKTLLTELKRLLTPDAGGD